MNYYKDLLTGDPEDYAVYARSPFDEQKRLLLIGTDVSSRYTRRGKQSTEEWRNMYAERSEAAGETI